ncbi:hypothetical protein FO519_004902 [Halicephalobus sp. NKZ332]|nr:hypothetical protein FO519_004902 [Halicephalobus sp. NKZ332]
MKLIVLLLGISLIGVFCEDDDGCDISRIEFCFFKYMWNFGYIETPSYDIYLNNTIDYLHVNGWKGQDNICHWQKELHQCLGSSSKCVNTEVFERDLHLNKSDAMGYQTDYHIKQYHCTEGYNSLHNSFFCFMRVWTVQRAELDVCQNLTDLSNPQDCTTVSNSATCTIELFTRNCGMAIRHFICMSEDIEIKCNTQSCPMSVPHC